jgi:hypothetical protein
LHSLFRNQCRFALSAFTLSDCLHILTLGYSPLIPIPIVIVIVIAIVIAIRYCNSEELEHLWHLRACTHARMHACKA